MCIGIKGVGEGGGGHRGHVPPQFQGGGAQVGLCPSTLMETDCRVLEL